MEVRMETSDQYIAFATGTLFIAGVFEDGIERTGKFLGAVAAFEAHSGERILGV